MNRKEFIEKSLIMGAGLPFFFAAFLQSCSMKYSFFPQLQTGFKGKVIIVGAGAAGMAAGYLLKRHNVDFEILEAAPVYGGRLKKASNFADFPIDLGAEWIHVNPVVLAEIVGRPTVDPRFETIEYNPQIVKSWKKDRLVSHNYLKSLYSEWKFKRSTWFDFFEQCLVPEIADKIILNKPVSVVNYETDKVILKTADNDSYEADKVLITVPIKILQNRQISFKPALPDKKAVAINQIFMGDGIKIFVEFRERFYPDILAFGNIFKALGEESKFVYDAAFKKDSGKHILGLFAINDKANAYTRLGSDEEIIQKFLAELDSMFEGKATASYVNHIIQNWSKEPGIQGAYSYSFNGKQKSIVQVIQESLIGKVYFAGEALSIDNQAMVQGACESAYDTIALMMEDA